jgi:hypothetical protein
MAILSYERNYTRLFERDGWEGREKFDVGWTLVVLEALSLWRGRVLFLFFFEFEFWSLEL